MGILGYLETAPGTTNEAQLGNAALNIRKFMMLNKQFYQYLNDQNFTEKLIKNLAQRYTGGDLLQAATALSTNAAGLWLQEKVKNPFNFKHSAMVRLFFDAIKKSDKNTINFILKFLPNNVLINSLDDQENTPLILAAQTGNIPLIKKIIEVTRRFRLQDQLNMQNEDGITPLIAAAIHNKTDAVKQLLSYSGINVNKQFTNEDFEDPATALIVAARYGNEQMVDALLQVPDIDINVGSYNQTDALKSAIQSRNPAIVKKLLSRKDMVIEWEPDDGDTYLHYAIESEDLETVKLILTEAMRVNPEIINLKSISSFSGTPLEIAIKEKSYPIARLLLAQPSININISPQDLFEYRSLLEAAIWHETEIAKLLLQRPDLIIKDSQPLIVAAKNNAFELIALLRKRPEININYQDNNGKTALFWAVENNAIASIEELLKFPHIDVNLPAQNGKNPLFVAMEKDNAEIVMKLLTDSRTDVNFQYQIHDVIEGGLMGQLYTEFIKSPQPKVEYIQNMTPLMYAIKSKNHTIIDFLLTRNDINLNLFNANNETALMMAVKTGDINLVEKIVKRLHSIENIDLGFNDINPLTLAALQGDANIVRFLLQSGATPHLRNAQGQSLIQQVAASTLANKKEIISIMLEHGATE